MLVWIGFAAGRRNLYLFFSRQVFAGERVFRIENVLDRTLCDDFAAMHPSPGADVYDMVGVADGVFVVFDHNHRIAKVAQMKKGF